MMEMNELQVETIKLEPAKIEFNHEEIEKELVGSLAKYQNLTLTDKNTPEIRKALAELRKGKEAVNRYRIDTKNKLSVSITEFEDKCKELTKQFDDTINPINEQLQDFIQKQREEKRAHLEENRTELIAEHGLNEKYAEQVVVEDQYLNASTSYKQATDSMEFMINNLKSQQDKEEADKQIVETTVKLANAENDLSFSSSAYVRLLEFDGVDDVKEQIEKDASKAVEERLEKEKQKEVAEKVKQDIEEEAQYVVTPKEEVPFDDFPFGDVVEAVTSRVSYVIVGNDVDHQKVYEFLEDNEIYFHVEKEMPF